MVGVEGDDSSVEENAEDADEDEADVFDNGVIRAVPPRNGVDCPDQPDNNQRFCLVPNEPIDSKRRDKTVGETARLAYRRRFVRAKGPGQV